MYRRPRLSARRARERHKLSPGSLDLGDTAGQVIAGKLGPRAFRIRPAYNNLAQAAFCLAERPQQVPVNSRQVAIQLGTFRSARSELRPIRPMEC